MQRRMSGFFVAVVQAVAKQFLLNYFIHFPGRFFRIVRTLSAKQIVWTIGSAQLRPVGNLTDPLYQGISFKVVKLREVMKNQPLW